MNDREDVINLNDDQPELIFGPNVNGKHQMDQSLLSISVLPSMIRFYTTLC